MDEFPVRFRSAPAYSDLTPISFVQSPSMVPGIAQASGRKVTAAPAHQVDRVGAIITGAQDAQDDDHAVAALRDPNLETDHERAEREHPTNTSHVRRLPAPHAQDRAHGRRHVPPPLRDERVNVPHKAAAQPPCAQASEHAADLMRLTNASPFASTASSSSTPHRPGTRGAARPSHAALRVEVQQFLSGKCGGVRAVWVRLARREFVKNVPSVQGERPQSRQSTVDADELREQLQVLMQRDISADDMRALVGSGQITLAAFVAAFDA